MKRKVAIIGGGASGFFTAANLDASKYDICIFEQSADVLQKVKISGGGRCNVSHACFDPKELIQFYPRGNKELLSVFHKFQPSDTMAWFEEKGVELKIEDDNRIFPQSNSSQTIIDCLVNGAKLKNIEIKLKEGVSEIVKKENSYNVKTSQNDYEFDIVIYTTGSSPKSYKILENLGHKIIPTVPSLFTFNIKDKVFNELMGTSFPYAEVSIPKLKGEEFGPMLITHWGISGPAVLKLSARNAIELARLNYNLDIKINFLGLSSEQAEEMILEQKSNHPKKTIGQSKIFEITQRFWQYILNVSNINPNKQIANITAKEVETLVNNLCHKVFTVNGKSTFKEEFVTAGGVDLKEINFKNMESKLFPNLYIAGEVLNIDALTGGFNFQACWSEGWLISQNLNVS